MKPLFALAVVSLSLLSPGLAEEAGPKFSLVVRWTPPGGEAVETKVPDLDLLSDSSVQLPVARGEAGDPIWLADLSFDLRDETVVFSISDRSQLQAAKDGTTHPIEISNAAFALGWNKEIVVFDSAHGKLSFLPGLVGSLPKKKEQEGKNEKQGGKNVRDDLAEKIEFSHKVTRPGSLSFEVYNPTEFSVRQVMIRVKVPASEGHAGFDRLYEVGVSWPPFGDGEGGITIPKLTEYPEGTPVEVVLEKVY